MYKIGKLGWKSIMNTCFIPYYNLYGSPDQIRHFLKKYSPRFGAILYRKLAEVSSDFFLNFSCAHKHSRQSSYKKLRKTKGIYRKTRKPLRRREHCLHIPSSNSIAGLLLTAGPYHAFVILPQGFLYTPNKP